ncbi:bifunctional folylpolyglutamate synthase/dihydrofolate synthase [Flavobacterium aquatile]|uniref:Dihydrofolate synthase/folylpolyglutamate synthase n=1 Tax=Flavobacterium aquatile LMG 4008 = ATCC 11947 TaxID=1453498 RepID=A0A095UZI1_9FLAO|nr:folylpolyglutamate synthase/dihydrofolate synthase family protein [Flavobacterium aquatile]KGD68000.1 tetrahydrofolate synthase [Flavobacterium aquatile LMG 4008 = ATCC 11947]OXA68232.1 tetrahydrofolate synthase [Flavobacterium aquatile LMG 4008 = ATCC 11947]GEC79864.1 tetrahydrofolate synthase [Flavobacterium aquatile]
MNYQETTNWLFNQLPMYQTQGATAYKKDLTNTLLLAEHLNHPEKELKCIHVAGTNGKGSTSHLLASVFQEAGYKVGLYTSPHLKDFRERIKINNEEISEEFVCEFVAKNKSFFETNDLSFFEMTVGLAFQYFVKEKTDINIIEVGMGGRLDSTNIITPLVSVITNIGFDHTQFLGNTLEDIAYEKAGIIKNNIPVVIGEYTQETKEVFLTKSKETHSDIYFASDLINETYKSALLGDYQIHNKKTVQQTVKVIQTHNKYKISEENIKNGFLNVIKNTDIKGRWQQLNENPKVICDTAHNSHGLKIVLNQIQNEKFNELHIVLGVVNDKDLSDILPLFPKKAKYYFCKPNIPRGLNAGILEENAKKHSLEGKVYNSVSNAYTEAMKNATTNDFIYIGGSTFVVAEVL